MHGEYSRVREWQRKNSRLNGEDSVAAYEPSQAKNLTKREQQIAGGEKELRTLAKTEGGQGVDV